MSFAQPINVISRSYPSYYDFSIQEPLAKASDLPAPAVRSSSPTSRPSRHSRSRHSRRSHRKPRQRKEKSNAQFDITKQCFSCHKPTKKCHCKQGQMFKMIGATLSRKKKPHRRRRGERKPKTVPMAVI
jgi:hypothetical protein